MKQLASSPGHTHSPSLQKWLHSDQAFTPDNDNKTEIKVNIMDSGGVVSYEGLLGTSIAALVHFGIAAFFFVAGSREPEFPRTLPYYLVDNCAWL